MESFELLPFYRGISGKSLEAPYVGKTRKDRVPRNTRPEMHFAADQWFESRFGVKYRSQALFLSGRRFTASGYGESPEHVVRVIPLGAYSFCWSPRISDLLSVTLNVQTTDGLLEELNAAGYRESGLQAAHESGNELMLFCERYIAVPLHLLEEPGQPSGPENESISVILLP